MRRGNPIVGRVMGVGRRRNVTEGFIDKGGVFHPIRGAVDYDPRRAGESSKKHKRGRGHSARARKRGRHIS